jgi:hypothetical protein
MAQKICVKIWDVALFEDTTHNEKMASLCAYREKHGIARVSLYGHVEKSDSSSTESYRSWAGFQYESHQIIFLLGENF